LYIDNRGDADATHVMVSLDIPNCNISADVDLGTIPLNTAGVPAEFQVEPLGSMPCPAENLKITVDITCDESPYSFTDFFGEHFNADWRKTLFFDDMEGTEPNGWSHYAAIGLDDWQYVSPESHSPDHSWFCSDYPAAKDDYLETPVLNLYDGAQLTFWHKINMECQGDEWAYDGCVAEISIDGGTSWNDLGTHITQGAYTHTIYDWAAANPLHGEEVWSGSADWSHVIVDLSAFSPGEAVIRFRLACDENSTAGGTPGWWIDDVAVDERELACQHQDCTGDCTYGDLDNDTMCDSVDLLLLANYFTGNVDQFTCDALYGDLNRDWNMNVPDLSILLNYLTGNIPDIPLP